MKQSRYLHYIIGVMLCGAFFSSCLDDNEPETFFPTLGTINADGKELLIESDSYGLLIPDNPGVITSTKTDSTGQRVLAGFQYTNTTEANKQSGTRVHLIRLDKILTKKANDLRIEGTEDIFGNSPIQITAGSISQEHLNLQYEYYGSTNIAHRISLVLNESTKLDQDGLLRVEFRHNNEGDNASDPLWGMVSYTLESIPEFDDTDCKGFKVIYNSGANAQAEWIIRKNLQGTQTEQNPSRLTTSCCF